MALRLWLGFPKSLDVSKAIDKKLGAERVVIAEGKPVKRMIPGADQNKTGSWTKDNGRIFVPTVTAPATPEAKQWEGWGTALKPAVEVVIWATKGLTAVPDDDTILSLEHVLEMVLCHLCSVKSVEQFSKLNPRGCDADLCDFVRWIVGRKSTMWFGGESEKTDMFNSQEAGSIFLSIVLLWNAILDANWRSTNISTTSTAISRTTELKTLRSLVSGAIYRSIIHQKSNQISGLNAFVSGVESVLNGRRILLRDIQRHSVPDNVTLQIGRHVLYELAIFAERNLEAQILQESIARQLVTISPEPDGEQNVSKSFVNTVARLLKPIGREIPNIVDALVWRKPIPNVEPIILARKPLSEATVAENVLKWGTGGINVDGCRLPTQEDRGRKQGKDIRGGKWSGDGGKSGIVTESHPLGRFPANVLLDEEAAAMLDEQSGISKSRASGYNWGESNNDNPVHVIQNIKSGLHYDDKGGASRFFYVAKASRSERTMGGKAENNHVTVKPLKLMRYLCRLIAPPGGLILDPFAGSGTTLLAAVQEGFSAIGIEREPAYCEIIRQRMTAAQQPLPLAK